jgi:hypothetical protein
MSERRICDELNHPPRPALIAPRPSAGSAEWHVALAATGPGEERCPCAKGPCGLAIPRADVLCPVHQGRVEYGQAHSAHDCVRPVWLRMGRKVTRLR